MRDVVLFRFLIAIDLVDEFHSFVPMSENSDFNSAFKTSQLKVDERNKLNQKLKIEKCSLFSLSLKSSKLIYS